MAVGGGEEEEQRQARAAAEQGVDAIAPQQGTGVVVRRMAHRRIGVTAPPRQDRSTIDDEVAPADEAQMPCELHGDHQQHFAGRRTHLGAAATLLRGAGHGRTTLGVKRQPANEGQRGPGHQPVMQILIRQAPQRADERQQQERFLAISARATPRTRWQWRWALPVSQLHRQPAQRQQL
jgi:hypothetical protein